MPAPDPRFSILRYAQVWEDADILLEGLEAGAGARCLSIASAGDNALALLTTAPERVLAIDFSRPQLAALELRVGAFRELTHPELLELIGSRPSAQRPRLYDRCRKHLSDPARTYWDHHPQLVVDGIGTGGKFERYFRIFRRGVLPLIHSKITTRALFLPRTREQREAFYEWAWDNHRWKLLFHLFFSRRVMGRLGRDPSFFRYVEGSVAERILERTRHALVVLDPCRNPYLQWILLESHPTALPLYLREEHFETIRGNLDRLEWRQAGVEEVVTSGEKFTHFNLSDIFEYLDPASYLQLLRGIVGAAEPGSRLAYWNMLAPRSRPEAMEDLLVPLEERAARLHREDKAFFYSRFVLEEVA